MGESSADRVRAVLATAPVIDGHNDLLWELRERVRYDLDAIDIARDQTGIGLHTDIPRLRKGGVGAQFWSVYVPPPSASGSEPVPAVGSAVTATLEQIDAVRSLVARYPDDLVMAYSAGDIEAAHRSGRIASLLGMEGGHSIDCSLGALRSFYALGVRYLTLTHTKNLPWADSATDVPGVGGLSRFGREVVRECNRLGMLVDLSHVADTTMHAALDTSTAPAFFSHSSARALCEHPRNVPDDVLVRVRDSGGVVMATFVPGFVNRECLAWIKAWADAFDSLDASADPAQRRAAMDEWRRANPRPPSSITDVADHIDYIRDVAGVDHVGIGSDFDGTPALPEGLDGVDHYPMLLEQLARRGWSDSELAKLTWHNALRVIRDTEAAARAAQRERDPSLATIAELDGYARAPS